MLESSEPRGDRWLAAREVIVSVGYLSGLGAEPITVTSNAFEKYLAPLAPQYGWMFVLAPWLLIFLSIVIMYGISKPHWLGLVALGLGFVAGALTFTVSIYCTLLVFVALGLGFIATTD